MENYYTLTRIEQVKALADPLAVRPVGNPLSRSYEVVLVVGVLDVSQQLPSVADEVETSAQEIPRGSHLGRGDVGLRQEPTPE